VVGRSYDLPTIALRYLCTYGSRQALGNPYTGVAAIWATRLLNRRRPVIFEDGQQRRDFIHVSDVVRATLAAADAPPEADYFAFNIGSGKSHTISELAERLIQALGSRLAPEITGEYRAGDIRHCFADVSRAFAVFGWEPRVDLTSGVEELVAWAAAQHPNDTSDAANAELRARGVIR
jgi:dTDP-L-rhamnose 4-epimerase